MSREGRAHLHPGAAGRTVRLVGQPDDGHQLGELGVGQPIPASTVVVVKELARSSESASSCKARAKVTVVRALLGSLGIMRWGRIDYPEFR